MKKWIASILLITIIVINVLGVGGLTVYGAGQASAGNAVQEQVQAQDNLYKVQLPFIENQGQVADPSVRYFAHTFAGTVFCTNEEIGYTLQSEDGTKSMNVHETFAGAKDSEVTGQTRTGTEINYFFGSDSSAWKKNVASYQSVSYGEIYDSITLNLKAYGNNVEKVFHVAPGGDPAKIQLKVDGADKLSVDAEGQMVFERGEQNMKLTKPVAYQEIDGKHVDIPVAYDVKGNGYGFALGTYDKTHELVIDPLLASTLVGGTTGYTASGSPRESVSNIKVHGDSIYLSGRGTLDFPVAKDGNVLPVDKTITGVNTYMVVFKFDKDLKNVEAASFISKQDGGGDYINSMMFDADGYLLISGNTHSSDFPTTEGTYKPSKEINTEGNSNCFIIRMEPYHLNIVASTVFGGTNTDGIESMALAKDGSIYIMGSTTSSDFPVTTKLRNSLTGGYYTLADVDYSSVTDGVYNSVTGSVYDVSLNNGGYSLDGNPMVYVAKLSGDLTTLKESTIVGYGNPAGQILIDPNGDIFIDGSTDEGSSTGYPITSNAYQTRQGSNHTCYISKLDKDLKELKVSTFLGKGNRDLPQDMVMGSDGDIYITGITTKEFPVTQGAYDTDSSKDEQKMFIARMNNGLTELLGATFLGNNTMWPHAITLDSSKNVYVCGMAAMPYEDDYSSDIFPTTKGAYRTQPCPGGTAFVSKLSSGLDKLEASTYVGYGELTALAIDGDTNTIYVAGTADGNMNTSTGAETAALDYPVNPTEHPEMDYPVINNCAAGNYNYPRIKGIFDYPVTSNACQTQLKGGADICISKFDLNLSADEDAPSLENVQLTAPAEDIHTTSLTLNWNKPASSSSNDSIVRYRIFKGWEPIGNVDSNTTSFMVTGLTQGQNYNFRIEAQNSTGKWSTDGPTLSVSAKAGDTVAPAWPSGSKLYVTELTSNSVSLRWDAATDNKGVKAYNIYKPASNGGPDGNLGWVATVLGDQLTYNATYLDSGTGYHFIVKAVDEDNNESSGYLYQLVYTHFTDTDTVRYTGAYLTTLRESASSIGRKVTGVNDIPVLPTIKVAFTQDMTSNNSIWTENHKHIRLVDSSGATVDTELSRLAGEPENIFITPVEPLKKGETYTIKMDAWDLVAAYSTSSMAYGISPDDPTDIPFTVIGEGVTPAGPDITYLSPAYDGTDIPSGVAVDQSISVGFSAPVDPNTVLEAKLVAADSQEKVPVKITFDEFNTVATITPLSSLNYGTHYKLTLPGGLADTDGNLAEGSHTLEFYTQSFHVDTAHTITLDTQNATGHFDGKVINKSGSKQSASVYVVARGGIGAREDHGGTVLGSSRQNITVDKGGSADVALDFDTASGTIYVDVYVWDNSGQYIEAEPAHFTCTQSN